MLWNCEFDMFWSVGLKNSTRICQTAWSFHGPDKIHQNINADIQSYEYAYTTHVCAEIHTHVQTESTNVWRPHWDKQIHNMRSAVFTSNIISYIKIQKTWSALSGFPALSVALSSKWLRQNIKWMLWWFKNTLKASHIIVKKQCHPESLSRNLYYYLERAKEHKQTHSSSQTCGKLIHLMSESV